MESDASLESRTLLIDAGQTGMRATMQASHESDMVEYPGIRTDLPLVPQLADVVRRFGRQAGGIDRVCAGVSGLTAGESAHDLLEAVRPLGVTDAVLAHDSVSSYLGALGEKPGVVVASGTGVVVLAASEDGAARVDGWGYLIGDAGSGYWIGRAALDAVMRAFDGRGPATALTGVVLEEFPDLGAAYIGLQSDPARVSRIARYARIVADLAPTDTVAAGICTAAADELFSSVVAANARVRDRDDGPPEVVAVGGVFKADAVRTRFDERIRAEWAETRVRSGVVNSLAGVASLSAAVMSPAWQQLIGRATVAS